MNGHPVIYLWRAGDLRGVGRSLNGAIDTAIPRWAGVIAFSGCGLVLMLLPHTWDMASTRALPSDSWMIHFWVHCVVGWAASVAALGSKKTF